MSAKQGSRTCLGAWRCAWLVMLCISAATADSAFDGSAVASDEIAEKITSLQVPRGAAIAYRETRMSDKLREPIILEGTMSFSESGELRKTVTTPFAEVVVANDVELQLVRNGKTRRLSAQKNKGLYSFFRGLRAALSGDYAVMNQLFVLSMQTTNEGAWRIECGSRDPAMAAYMEQMTLSGRGDRILRIAIEQKDRWQQIDILPDPAASF